MVLGGIGGAHAHPEVLATDAIGIWHPKYVLAADRTVSTLAVGRLMADSGRAILSGACELQLTRLTERDGGVPREAVAERSRREGTGVVGPADLGGDVLIPGVGGVESCLEGSSEVVDAAPTADPIRRHPANSILTARAEVTGLRVAGVVPKLGGDAQGFGVARRHALVHAVERSKPRWGRMLGEVDLEQIRRWRASRGVLRAPGSSELSGLGKRKHDRREMHVA